MKIEDINDKMGDLTQELSKQFQTEFIRLAETEEGLLGLMHEIAESPEMYFSMLGPKIVHLANAYNEAVNCYMSLDEILTDEWCESMPSPVGPEFGEGPPTITPDVLRFPTDATIDPFDYPNGPRLP
mgnify:CR=1 FL=1|tara:strand:- start:232 stop:612 length:381 start_codon:yes stop_codon:yes gene_type:complete